MRGGTQALVLLLFVTMSGGCTSRGGDDEDADGEGGNDSDGESDSNDGGDADTDTDSDTDADTGDEVYGTCCLNDAYYECPTHAAFDRCAGPDPDACMEDCAFDDFECRDDCLALMEGAEHDPSDCHRDSSRDGTCEGGGGGICVGDRTGVACDYDGDCTTGNCYDGECYESAVGNPCEYDGDCASNSCYDSCCTGTERGDGCDYDGDCDSNVCTDNVCQ